MTNIADGVPSIQFFLDRVKESIQTKVLKI